MKTNYNRDEFIRSLEKLCLLHSYDFEEGFEPFSELLSKVIPPNFNPLANFKFKPVYTFETDGNTNEFIPHIYDVEPIFTQNGYLLDRTTIGSTSCISDIDVDYELWLLDDMSLVVTKSYSMKVQIEDKFEKVSYRQFIKDGLYRLGEDFDADDFVEKIEYLVAQAICYNSECDENCDDCGYDEIISAFEDDYEEDDLDSDDFYTDDYFDDECDDCPYKDECEGIN